jgi:hypothetical protein
LISFFATNQKTMTMIVLPSSWVDDYRCTTSSSSVALFGLKIFLFVVSLVAFRHGQALFLSWHGWSHRLAGAMHLCWLGVGAWTIVARPREPQASTHDDNDYAYQYQYTIFGYDLILGLLGILATLTAARDFPHKCITTNKTGQWGTLHRKAMVTQAEMMEHAFYQGLNLWQTMYLHALSFVDGNLLYCRLILLWLVAAPWLVRHKVPVHSFSHNWNTFSHQKKQQQRTDTPKEAKDAEVLLYRIKKGQYLFHKHVILHGVNLSLAVSTTTTTAAMMIPYSTPWRVFWILLNTSYVVEFFLQTLVKRNVLRQSTMLRLQQGLMVAASLAALVVLQQVYVWICGLSLGFEFCASTS